MPPNPHPLPLGLSRVGQVLLFRRRSGFALTPDVLERWRTYWRPRPATADDNDGADGDTDTGTSSGHLLHPCADVDPDYLGYTCPDCNDPIRPAAQDLLWDSRAHKRTPRKHLRPERTPNYDQWIRPVGALEDRHAVLDSLPALTIESGLLHRLLTPQPNYLAFPYVLLDQRAINKYLFITIIPLGFLRGLSRYCNFCPNEGGMQLPSSTS